MIRTTNDRTRRVWVNAKLGILLVVAYVTLIPVMLIAIGTCCWLALLLCKVLYSLVGDP